MGGITLGESAILWQQGEALLGVGRAAEAERVFRDLLARLSPSLSQGEGTGEGVTGPAFDAGYQRCVVLGSLGRCLRAQGRPGEAAEVYRQKIEAARRLEQTDEARKTIGAGHTDLADALTDLGRYAAARAEYEAALDIMRGLGDDRSVSVVLGQLGTLALVQGDLTEARHRFLEALEFDLRVGDPRDQAIDWHQLGLVAQEARDWDEAERCYKESLAIKERIGDKALAATTCNQLAIVAKSAGRPAEAERWYRRAIGLGEEVGDVKGVALRCSNLAGLLLDQGRLDEAERYAHRARQIKETMDLSVEPWKTYALLAGIAEQRGRPQEARAWRRKEQESFAAFAGSAHQIRQFQPLIAAIVRAAQRDDGARAWIEGEYPKMETGDWRNVPPVIRRILDGERDLKALTANLNREAALIIRQVLAALAGGGAEDEGALHLGGATHLGTPPPEEADGITLDQLLALVARAAGRGRDLGAQLFPLAQQMARDPSLPPELRALGGVLVRLLAGERDPDLSALPPELAAAVRQMLAG